jgi:hypothetical protein
MDPTSLKDWNDKLKNTVVTTTSCCHPSHVPVSGVGSYQELVMHSEIIEGVPRV